MQITSLRTKILNGLGLYYQSVSTSLQVFVLLVFKTTQKKELPEYDREIDQVKNKVI